MADEEEELETPIQAWCRSVTDTVALQDTYDQDFKTLNLEYHLDDVKFMNSGNRGFL